MPPRNNPLPSAVRLFNCTICDKGYPRQLDYENHLRSYDHNHRQRLADMKKLTASNDPESSKPKQGLDMRSINVDEANRKMGTGGGGRFTKIGGAAGGAGIVGRGFKKVGTAVGEKKDVVGVDKGEEKKKAEEKPAVVAEAKAEEKKEEDTVMAGADDEEEEVTWEQYDFTKPTGCDHASCAGCRTDGIWSGEWVAV